MAGKRKKTQQTKLEEPWFRESRNAWFVCLNGKQHNLGADHEKAKTKFHELLAGKIPEVNSQPNETPVMVLLDRFLDWVQNNRNADTYDSYKRRLKSFTDFLKAANRESLSVERFKPLHITEWIDSHPNWNPGMRRGRMGAVQRALNWAVKQGHIERSPLVGLEKPSQGKRETVSQAANVLVTEGMALDQVKIAASRCEPLPHIVNIAKEILMEQGFVQIRGLPLSKARQLFLLMGALFGEPYVDPVLESAITDAHVRPGEPLMGCSTSPLHPGKRLVLW